MKREKVYIYFGGAVDTLFMRVHSTVFFLGTHDG